MDYQKHEQRKEHKDNNVAKGMPNCTAVDKPDWPNCTTVDKPDWQVHKLYIRTSESLKSATIQQKEGIVRLTVLAPCILILVQTANSG